MMRDCVRASLLAALVTTPWLGHAHSIQVPQAFHGGKAQAMGPYHVELVLSDGQVELYVYDRDNVMVSAEDVKAKALVWTQDSSIDLPLMSEKRNRLGARAAFKHGDVQRVIVTIDQKDEKPLSAWFTYARRQAGTTDQSTDIDRERKP